MGMCGTAIEIATQFGKNGGHIFRVAIQTIPELNSFKVFVEKSPKESTFSFVATEAKEGYVLQEHDAEALSEIRQKVQEEIRKEK